MGRVSPAPTNPQQILVPPVLNIEEPEGQNLLETQVRTKAGTDKCLRVSNVTSVVTPVTGVVTAVVTPVTAVVTDVVTAVTGVCLCVD